MPAFGPNILRTIHVTAVMTVCARLGINKNDDRVLNHFALTRHGEYEMRKAYDLAKADNDSDDPNSFSAQFSGIIGTLNFEDTGITRVDLVKQQDAALEKLFSESNSCWYDQSATPTSSQGEFETLKALFKGGVLEPS